MKLPVMVWAAATLVVLGRAQAIEFEVISPMACASPLVISCGALPIAAGRPGTTRVVRAFDAAGRPARAVIVAREWGAVGRILVPDLPAGRSRLRIEAAAESLAPIAWNVHGGAITVDAGRLRLTAEADGSVHCEDLVTSLSPGPMGEGRWEVVDVDPLRIVLRFSGVEVEPGLAPVMFVTVGRDEPRMAFRLACRRNGGAGFAGRVGLRFAAPDRQEDDEPADDEDVPGELGVQGREAAGPAARSAGAAGPGFDAFGGWLDHPRAAMFAPLGAAWAVEVEPFGPAAPPVAVVEQVGAIVVPAGDQDIDLAVGETRLIDAVASFDGQLVPDWLARPARVELKGPARGEAANPAGATELVPIARALDLALDAWVGDADHGIGWRDRDLGDWRLDAARHGNGEWDTALGFFWRWRTTGEARWARLARAAAIHFAAVDRDAAGSGLAFQHGPQHRSGVVEAGHHWVEGARLVADAFDDPWLRGELARTALDQVALFERTDWAHQLPRSLAWGLTALVALHDLVPDRFRSMAAIRRLAEFAYGRLSRTGHLLIEPAEHRAGCFRISPFVDGGILLPALHRTAAVVRLPGDTEHVQRSFAALLRDGLSEVQGRLRLASSLIAEPNEGRVVKVADLVAGEEVVLFVAGARACGVDDPRLSRLLATASAELHLPGKTYPGKEISMLLRALPGCAVRSAGAGKPLPR